MRAVMMPFARPVCAALRTAPRCIPTAPAPSFAAIAPQVAFRGFAAAAMKKPKHEDGTLQGRYATALFMASGGKVKKVYEDLVGLRTLMNESPDFKMVVLTPSIEASSKIGALTAVCKHQGCDDVVVNFLKVLIENRRISMVGKIIDLFETFYRTETGQLLCTVTSAVELTDKQKTQVKSAMVKRAEKGSTLIMEYDTNPALMGGLVVKMGEAVLDQSTATRLERMQTRLLAPVA